MPAGRGRAGSGEQRNRRGSAGTLQFAAAVVVAPTYPQAVFALDYPTRSLRWIVGFPPGGGSDTVMRITANGCRSAPVSRSSSKTSPAPPPTSRSRRPSALAPDGYTLVFIAGSATVKRHIVRFAAVQSFNL
jgi:tripartite-type tricarboxylate transporter receptor subunit TctC